MQPTPAITTRVLLIDDHQLTRSLLRGLLREAGYVSIREAADADSGLKMAGFFMPQLICLDMHMPGRSGLAVLGELKACVPNCAVLMVTASSERETVLACMNAGASGYIVKPFNARTIMDVIDAAMNKRKTAPAPVPPEQARVVKVPEESAVSAPRPLTMRSGRHA